MLSNRFRWAFCQLEALRHCLRPSLRLVLAALPESLDQTYERILLQIRKSNRVHARRLLQCLVVAVRPLHLEELAEVLAIDFSTAGKTPLVNEKLRWEDQQNAVLSTCSSLITIIEDSDSRVVQFSHFSVKEFLTSGRLATSNVDALRDYHISLGAAHKVMAQSCLAVLLRLDKMDSRTIEWSPLTRYAAAHFHDHAKYGDVLLHITDGVDDLLDPKKPHFDPWVWLQIGDWNPSTWHNAQLVHHVFSSRHSSCISLPGAPKYPPQIAPLYYVAALGHLCLAQRLLLTRPQDLCAKDDKGCSPFHIAVLAGKVEVSQLLSQDFADLDIRDIEGHNLLHMAAWKGHREVAQMLLEHDKNKKELEHDKSKKDLEHNEDEKKFINARNQNGQTPLHVATQHNQSNIVELLLKFDADANAEDNDGMTPLFYTSQSARSSAVVRLLLAGGARVDVRNKNGQTPLHVASQHVNHSNVTLLLRSGAAVDEQDNDKMTPLLWASQSPRSGSVAWLLLKNGASVKARNSHGQTPLHFASENNFPNVVALMLQLGAEVNRSDNDGMTPLLCCAIGPYRSGEVARLLLKKGANVHAKNSHGQTPLHLASENNFPEIVALLLAFGADVDAQDDSHMTPLHVALSSSSWSSGTSCSSWSSWSCSSSEDLKKVIDLLLEHHANVHLRNDDGKTPLQIASELEMEWLFP